MVTEHGPQDDIGKRATKSGVQGYSAETDDWLHDIEHEEERIDPNREVSAGRSGGSPMMMPPMMGGGGGGGTTGASGGLGGGLGAAGMGGFGAGARAGTFAGGGPGGTTPAGVGSIAGSGGGGQGESLGGGGLGGGTLAASSGGAGLDGVATDGDGTADTFAGGGADTDGDGIPDSWPGGGIDTDGDGVPDRWPGGGSDTDGDGIPDSWPGATVNTGDHQPPAHDPFGGTQDGGPGDIDVDQVNLNNGAKEWAEMSERMSSVLNRARYRAATTQEFGFVTGPNPQYNEMTGAITAWSTSATSEFSLISDNLVADMQAYRRTEDANAAGTAAITKELDA